MTKGIKSFRIIICILLGILMLWTGFISYAFFYFVGEESAKGTDDRYGLYVGGVDITNENASDIFGNGTASYNAKENKLTLSNSVIEYNHSIIYSEIDLQIELIGENKFICKDTENVTAVYASNGILRKDISFDGEGTLDISFENISASCTGIVADDLYIGSDVTITTPDSSNISNGIVCASVMTLRNNAAVTVNNGAARSSTAVTVNRDTIIENGSALEITVKGGSVDACNGLCVNGNLVVGRNAVLNVNIDDESVENGECVSVYGIVDICRDSKVTATAKKTCGISCYSFVSIDEGATVNAEIEALGEIVRNAVS